MDAVSHPETAIQKAIFRRGRKDAAVGSAVAAPRPESARGSVLGEVKRQLMDAVSNVETVAQIGWMKVGGAAAVYAAHIRQVDRETRQRTAQRSTGTPQKIERLERDI